MKKFNTKISINGEFIEAFESITLEEQTYNHHYFCVELDYNTVEKTGTHTIDASKKWLGKELFIEFGDYSFTGIVTNMELVKDNGYESKLHLSGYSKTILLEAGEHVQSWLEKNLTQIVQEVADQGAIKTEISPKYTETLEYECQYNESHYGFIQRLAKQHNEWLYYDGQKLLFGKPSSQKPAIELVYGKDLSYLNLEIEAKPHNFGAFSYDSLTDKKHSEKVKGNIKGLNELGSHAFKASKEVFKLATNKHYNGVFNDKSKIENAIKGLRASKMANNHVIKGRSNRQSLSIGSIIKVAATGFKDGEAGSEEKPYGEYIITEITHEAGNKDSYKNEFTAISASVEVLPNYSEIDLPIAEPQLATVTSNEDPKKKGRVQVQFQWQSGAMKTSWIPVLAPDGGKSDNVSTNRGFVFIPEQGDQVMIGFRYNSPSRPFVMGSFFNGKTGAGGSDTNKMKSITTRSGSMITFDDNEKSLLLKDADGNLTTYDGKGNVVISANKSITLNVGKSSIHMDKEGNIIISGQSVVCTGEKEATLLSAPEGGEGSFLSMTPTEAGLVGKTTLSMQGGNEASVNSKTTNIAGESKVVVAGKTINLN